jgi:hypothetical protein
MERMLMTGFAVLTLVTFVPVRAAAHSNAHAEAKAIVGKATVTISYNRPSLRGRDLMKMIHPGELWRMGADIPTTIESTQDLDFGGVTVPEGKHVLLARYVGPGQWMLVISSKDRLNYEPSAKLAEIPLQVEEGQKPVEELEIQLSGSANSGTIEIAWGPYRLTGVFSAL